MLTIAIVGRPNVGKTTLFNRLVGKKISIVDNMPGITRDMKKAVVNLYHMRAIMIDTPGLEDINKNNISIQSEMFQCGLNALHSADICLFVLDASSLVTEMDRFIINVIRKSGKPYLTILNKSDVSNCVIDEAEFLSLGLDCTAVSISAEHNTGMHELSQTIVDLCKQHNIAYLEYEAIGDGVIKSKTEHSREDKYFISGMKARSHIVTRDINVAIVGMPNVGKSTFMNKILGYYRVIVNEQSGTTRDAISESIEYSGRMVKIVDTAGIRSRNKITDKIEKMSVIESLHAIDLAHVVILLTDVDSVMDSQNLSIINGIVTNGRALIIGINKWDKINKCDAANVLAGLKDKVQKISHDLIINDFITLSALYDNNVDALLDEVILLYDRWSQQISTSVLNNWLRDFKERKAQPLVSGNRIKLKFISQITIRPPTFAISTNTTDWPQHYIAFLRKSITKDFNLHSIPVRIMLKKYTQKGTVKAVVRRRMN